MTGRAPSPAPGPPERVLRRDVDPEVSSRASRRWWDAQAGSYLAEHAAVLGTATLVWGPEGWREDQLRLLGDLTGRDVLELGCGAAQGARWCAAQGARVVALDLSRQMLAHGRAMDQAGRRAPVAYLQANARSLPLAGGSVDVVFSAYGALPFVADSVGVLREAARVLRAGGRLVFSVSHPFRWTLPDVPGEAGLTVTQSYFDRRPYVEEDATGQVVYSEHHRTLGDRVRELRAAGLVLEDLVEPEWPEGATHTWGGWSPVRGRLLPGTAIFCARRP
ncbi:class I SAM-dependent methyltransferase [Ornithinicoccus halotolerans]|uniref:class I SAM-dependent methyltransferase n=1 Tax=Ornithinicoccus halotolerans TaxID=1748220 RepID=UPI001E6255CF|nr:class I SAM-dependent methyltransferase [Ornithinicoccus halotolerans]